MALNTNSGDFAVADRPKAARATNLDEVLEIDSIADVGIIQGLIEKPPLRSVVVRLSPAASEEVLRLYNTRNRPMTKKNRQGIEESFRQGLFELTGDTLKFSKSGTLIDGQHRLEAAVEAEQPLESHAVFGLDDDVFDVLDAGRKRTPGDVLAIGGFKNGALLAGAVRWAIAFEKGETPQHLRLSSRAILKQAKTRFRDLEKWVSYGVLINKAYKHSPSMITALLFTIARQNKELAEQFVRAWHDGPWTGRNSNFTTLNKRLIDLAHETGGRLNHYVKAAMVVNCFNAWNAGIELTPRDPALAWKLDWRFPRIQLDGAEYRAELESRSRFAELTPQQRLAYVAIETFLKDGSRRVSKSITDLATLTNTRPNVLVRTLHQLEERGYLSVLEEGETADHPWTFQIQKDMAAAEGASA